jgi:hypothetical protein
MMDIFSGIIIILTSSFFLALTYGKNVMGDTKSILPSVLNGNKLVRVFMFILLAAGIYRVLEGVVASLF